MLIEFSSSVWGIEEEHVSEATSCKINTINYRANSNFFGGNSISFGTDYKYYNASAGRMHEKTNN